MIRKTRRMTRVRKIGHAGTLDPFATGILILCFGKATRRSAEMMALDKEYEATVLLGTLTDTLDPTGRITETAAVPALSERIIGKALAGFIGTIDQVPPMFSALKYGGRRLYQLAREGQIVELPPRPVRLDRIDLLDLSPLAPFTRQGLTNALLLIGLLAIASLFLLETGFGGMILRIGMTTLVMAALAVLPSVLWVRTRIRQAKDAELRRIDGAISTRRNALEDPDAGHRVGEMADLVAYRGRIDDVAEWPFTASTYARLILYMLIPMASWVLGGIAEELVGRALF